jgi:hypothetical protein
MNTWRDACEETTEIKVGIERLFTKGNAIILQMTYFVEENY